ncbi:MAG: hypothetical protein F6K04_21735 [Leptolyngbya sp. SIO4C5]|nr:hypothetical protein [Leptolyngbya sp. SIO4C5]
MLNVVATPLVTLISLGGIFSGIVALVWQAGGSAIAWLLYYPIHLLIALATFSNQQLGSAIAIAQVSILQVVGLYSLFILGWLQPWLRGRQWLVGAIACGLVIFPAWSSGATLRQITVLSAAQQSALVMQQSRQAVLISDGNAKTASYTVLPFLKQAGVNQLQAGIVLNNKPETIENWAKVQQQVSIQKLFAAVNFESQKLKAQLLPVGQTTELAIVEVQSLGTQFPVLRLTFQGQAWLAVGRLPAEAQQQLTNAGEVLRSQVIWWAGDRLEASLLDAVQPEVAIYSGQNLDEAVIEQLRNRGIKTFWTGRDGAIQWTPGLGFQAALAQGRDAIALE